MAPAGRFSGTFALLWLVALLGYLGFQLTTAGLPLYAVSLGADDAAVGLLSGVIALTSLVSRPWVGVWLDRGGARGALVISGCLFAASAAGFAASSSVGALIGFRVLSGLGIALLSTASQLLAVVLAPAPRRGEALSVLALALSLGQGIGPAAGVAMAARAGYRSLFGACAAASAAAALLAMTLPAASAASPARASAGMFHRGVVLPGVLLMALMASFGVNFALLAVHAVRRGLGNPGVAFTAFAAGQVASQILLRRISDRVGRAAAIIPGLALVAAGMAVSGLAGGWLLAAGAFLVGAGQGVAQPALLALASDLSGAGGRGRALATMGIFLELGIGAGAIGGGLVGRAVGLQTTYLLAAAGAAAAGVLGGAWLRRPEVSLARRLPARDQG
ncbi:MAG: MFS transporter [Armatimonadota bacterium]|nr:MFS transporter [Armatimonadota bacterium]MDR7401214.1 MFS transporter [Armatimonadota bacterium]MDR7403027.1 MFS transporter [Armatimonadota bacterium]MDR7437728.1 MFS transporter [Armatimonadota bacterium]MDR7471867.1 MFS transporter [Armatimonadota bacterium]